MPRHSWEWMPTYIYRLFDTDDDLLYVGITCRPLGRIPRHREKPWGREIAYWTLSDPISSRTEALRLETVAIRTERPEYNIAGAVRS